MGGDALMWTWDGKIGGLPVLNILELLGLALAGWSFSIRKRPTVGRRTPKKADVPEPENPLYSPIHKPIYDPGTGTESQPPMTSQALSEKTGFPIGLAEALKVSACRFGFSERQAVDHVLQLGANGYLAGIRSDIAVSAGPGQKLAAQYGAVLAALDSGNLIELDRGLLEISERLTAEYPPDEAGAVRALKAIADIANGFLCQLLAAERYYQACTHSSKADFRLPQGLLRSTIFFLRYNTRGGWDLESPEKISQLRVLLESVIVPRLKVLDSEAACAGDKDAYELEVVRSWAQVRKILKETPRDEAMAARRILDLSLDVYKRQGNGAIVAEIQYERAHVLDALYDTTGDMAYLEDACAAISEWESSKDRPKGSPLHEWEDEISPLYQKLKDAKNSPNPGLS